MEICYRYQVIDFYKHRTNALNTEKLNNANPTTLIFGDSFTGHQNSYVKTIRAEFPNHNFINTGISGTGIRQQNLIVQNRIKEYKPQRVIYQFYVGNDFTDILHPVNFKVNSFARNAYWFISDQFIFLQYANSWLAPFKSKTNNSANLKSNSFSPLSYNERVKKYFKADPYHLENTVNLEKNQLEIYKKWKIYFEIFLENIPNNIEVHFLIIPHCAQVSETYQDNISLIGASIKSPIQDVNYPLIKKIKKDFPNLIILNPLSYFQKADSEGKFLYFPNDPHLTKEGQIILGNYIVEQLYKPNIPKKFYKVSKR